MDQGSTTRSGIMEWMSVSGIKFHDMPHLFTIRTEDRRFFCSVAESLQDCCFACVSPPNHKDTESSKLCSDFSNLLCSELRLWWGRHCERCGARWCGMIRPFKLWLSQEHLAQVIFNFHYSLCAATIMFGVLGNLWNSVIRAPDKAIRSPSVWVLRSLYSNYSKRELNIKYLFNVNLPESYGASKPAYVLVERWVFNIWLSNSRRYSSWKIEISIFQYQHLYSSYDSNKNWVWGNQKLGNGIILQIIKLLYQILWLTEA